MKLESKIFITGDIVALTGLHIGGSKSSLDIGGVDLNVIKTPQGVPFIPGSSLKGKLRSMLARLEGSVGINRRDVDVKNGEKSDEDFPHIVEIFGQSGDETDKGLVTRLLVRDADLNTEKFNESFEEGSMDMEYSDVKWENTIDRKRGTAQHPRQLERVPAGASFKFEMVYDAYDDQKTENHLKHIITAMRLLEGDYLGGQGSRGYGKIRFENVQFSQKTKQDFQENNDAQLYTALSY